MIVEHEVIDFVYVENICNCLLCISWLWFVSNI